MDTSRPRSVHEIQADHSQEDERLKVAIKAAHVQNRETYGPLRMWPELVAQGFKTGRDRVVRLRREMGLRCKQKRRFKATTNSKPALPVASNLLDQTFMPLRPDEAWVSDITYIATGEVGFTWRAPRTCLRAR